MSDIIYTSPDGENTIRVRPVSGLFFTNNSAYGWYTDNNYTMEQMLKIFTEIKGMIKNNSFTTLSDTDANIDFKVEPIYIDGVHSFEFQLNQYNGSICFQVPYTEIDNIVNLFQTEGAEQVGAVGECDGCPYAYGSIGVVCYCTDKANDCRKINGGV